MRFLRRQTGDLMHIDRMGSTYRRIQRIKQLVLYIAMRT